VLFLLKRNSEFNTIALRRGSSFLWNTRRRTGSPKGLPHLF